MQSPPPQLNVVRDGMEDVISTRRLPLSPISLTPSRTKLIKSKSFDHDLILSPVPKKKAHHRNYFSFSAKTSSTNTCTASPSPTLSNVSSLSLASLQISGRGSRMRRSSSISSTASDRSISSNSSRSIRSLFSALSTKIQKNNSNHRMSQSAVDFTCESPVNNYNKPMHMRSKWRPKIKFIYNDKELLDILVEYMTKQYNEENILFLHNVNQLKKNVDHLLEFKSDVNIVSEEKINVEITDIYNKYIKRNALKQINLSSECFNNIMYIYQKFSDFNLTKKKDIFNICVNEIEFLVHTSILDRFYASEPFQLVAFKRNIFSNKDCIPVQIVSEQNTNTGCDEFFDAHSMVNWNDKTNKYILSANGYSAGCYELKIEILECNNLRQEFGVISNFDTKIEMNECGICETAEFGARAVYGFDPLNNSFYYSSYNADNTLRCNKNLSQLKIHQDGHWRKGDIIRICLNLSKGNIKYYFNGKQVRKSVSIQKNATYYPIIVYSGNCKYKVIDY